MITAHVENVGQVVNGFRAAQQIIPGELRNAMTASMLLLEADQRRRVPQDTRALAGSINSRIEGSFTEIVGKVGPSLEYGLYVEKGRRPGKMPPPRALEGWARRHGMNPFVLAKAIARRGTKAQPFVAPSLPAQLANIQGLFRQIGARVVATIARGG